jgi:hypothetical protein
MFILGSLHAVSDEESGNGRNECKICKLPIPEQSAGLYKWGHHYTCHSCIMAAQVSPEQPFGHLPRSPSDNALLIVSQCPSVAQIPDLAVKHLPSFICIRQAELKEARIEQIEKDWSSMRTFERCRLKALLAFVCRALTVHNVPRIGALSDSSNCMLLTRSWIAGMWMWDSGFQAQFRALIKVNQTYLEALHPVSFPAGDQFRKSCMAFFEIDEKTWSNLERNASTHAGAHELWYKTFMTACTIFFKNVDTEYVPDRELTFLQCVP